MKNLIGRRRSGRISSVLGILERGTRSDRISGGKKAETRRNMQRATMGFRDKSICRGVKFADTSFVAVTHS